MRADSRLNDEFARLIGADFVKLNSSDVVVEPTQIGQIVEIVRKCERDRIAVVPIGSGGSASLMRTPSASIAISLARMNRIIDYESADMTVSTQAGITLQALNDTLATRGQRLPVDPPHPELIMIGSLIAGAKAGPLRLSEGTIRDLLIGITFVGHEGRVVHAGGRVVKNVAGYDLMKVLTGSYGTLGVIVEAIVKLRPIPANYRLATAAFGTIDEAFAAADSLSALPLSHCDVVSDRACPSGPFTLYAGFAGTAGEVEYLQSKIAQALSADAEFVSDENAYETLRDWSGDDALVAAQLVVKPAELARSLEECSEVNFRAHALSGVAQLYSDASGEDAIAAIGRWRESAHRRGGHLRITALPSELRNQVEIFDTPSEPAMKLMRRLKAAFDPANIFNPGGFVGGL